AGCEVQEHHHAQPAPGSRGDRRRALVPGEPRSRSDDRALRRVALLRAELSIERREADAQTPRGLLFVVVGQDQGVENALSIEAAHGLLQRRYRPIAT